MVVFVFLIVIHSLSQLSYFNGMRFVGRMKKMVITQFFSGGLRVMAQTCLFKLTQLRLRHVRSQNEDL
jgi:hypothetical protein